MLTNPRCNASLKQCGMWTHIRDFEIHIRDLRNSTFHIRDFWYQDFQIQESGYQKFEIFIFKIWDVKIWDIQNSRKNFNLPSKMIMNCFFAYKCVSDQKIFIVCCVILKLLAIPKKNFDLQSKMIMNCFFLCYKCASSHENFSICCVILNNSKPGHKGGVFRLSNLKTQVWNFWTHIRNCSPNIFHSRAFWVKRGIASNSNFCKNQVVVSHFYVSEHIFPS